jgi:hypothetical protein
MLPFVPSLAAIFISALYCAWKRYQEAQVSSKKTMRQRVARLLWAVATHDEVPV